METVALVLGSIRKGDVMFSIDPKMPTSRFPFIRTLDRTSRLPCEQSLAVHGTLFWPLHSSAGLHQGVLTGVGVGSALNHGFILSGMHITGNTAISGMIRSFERSCSPKEIKPPDWNLSVVLRSLICLGV